MGTGTESDVTTVTIQGRQFSIHGRAGDPYFDGLADNSANEFFELVAAQLGPDAVCMDTEDEADGVG